jgi:hypothetical protein
VRSTIVLILASLGGLVGAVAPAGAEGVDRKPAVTVALLPGGTGLASMERIEGLAPGLMSAGIGRVPAAQTYLDITQGNRVSESLYEGDLPLLRFNEQGVRPEQWNAIAARAEDAPADVVPGLLASALEEADLGVLAERQSGLGRLIAVDREGRVQTRPRSAPTRCLPARCAVEVVGADGTELERLVRGREPGDLLIALERPPPAFRTLTMGIAGEGYEGLLTSDSTRTEGLVTATDLAPTILGHFGVAAPDEMNGQAIGSSRESSVEELRELAQRLEVTGERRGPVVGQTILAWVVVSALAIALLRGTGARVAVPLLCLSMVYLPFVLLLTALADPSLLAERLMAGMGAPLLALLTWRLAPGWPALAIACLVTVLAYAADVLAGSVLVPLSIPGPNPASGSRFFGIGNEIEATVAALLPLGVGALLASRVRTRAGGNAAALAFLAAGIAAAAVFALGRFGADVGAAIVLPVGAAVAAAVALGTRRGVALAMLVPLGCLVALMAADLVLGGDSHLTRSVLDAGGLSDAADVFERRVRLAASSFTRGANLPFLALAVAAIALGVWRRDAIRAWFAERAALAGFAGALAATAVGTVSNDSGVILLILGTTYAAVAAGYAWSLR